MKYSHYCNLIFWAASKIFSGVHSMSIFWLSKKIRTQSYFCTCSINFYKSCQNEFSKSCKYEIFSLLWFLMFFHKKWCYALKNTGSKINFFEFWFFCWVGNLINYNSLKVSFLCFRAALFENKGGLRPGLSPSQPP